jgi:thioredoxin-like negative regulator of GroEL
VSKGIEIIEFSGESCANCLTLMPILNRLAKKYDDVTLSHIELDEKSKDIIEKYEIDRVPTTMVLKDGKEIQRCRGFQPEEILELWLDARVEEARKM